MTFNPGDIISYQEMCATEGLSLQRGMNYRYGGRGTIILMSLRKGAPYDDRIEDNGRTLIYEGHDVPRTSETPIPKEHNQPLITPKGSLTENGKFFAAATGYKNKERDAEQVKVYEKIHSGVWSFNGVFSLTDAWFEPSGRREVVKYRLELLESEPEEKATVDLDHTRVIPSHIKLEVWKRDKGKCTICGETKNLHFDHIIPFSKGGSSADVRNIQILCAKHNLEKRDKII